MNGKKIQENHSRMHQAVVNAMAVNPVPYVLITYHIADGGLWVVGTSTNIDAGGSDNLPAPLPSNAVVSLLMKAALRETEEGDTADVKLLFQEKLS